MSSVRQFFISPDHISNDQVTLRGQDVTHIRTVLRLKPGDNIYVMDGIGNRYCVCLTHIQREEVLGKILSKDDVGTQSPLTIHMGQALLKGNKFDDIISKAVELGVHSLTPLITERCVVKLKPIDLAKKSVRWQKIALEAAKQCRRTVVPVVETGQFLDAFFQKCKEHELKIMFWENEKATRIKNLAVQKSPGNVAVVIGPEGGFTEAEVKMAQEYGFKIVSLGPRILRAETAPIAVLAILQNLYGDL